MKTARDEAAAIVQGCSYGFKDEYDGEKLEYLITAALESRDKRIAALRDALKVIKLKLEDIEGDPACGESLKIQRLQDIEWAGHALKTCSAALNADSGDV